MRTNQSFQSTSSAIKAVQRCKIDINAPSLFQASAKRAIFVNYHFLGIPYNCGVSDLGPVAVLWFIAAIPPNRSNNSFHI